MIFTRYLTKNILISFFLTTIVLMVILLGNLVVRLLTDIHEEGVYGGYLLPLIAFNLLDDLPLLLPLCLLIGVFLALNRLHRNSEMIAMKSLGVSIKQFIYALILISLPLSIVVLTLTMFVAPISMQLNDQYRNQFDIGNQLQSLISQSFALSLDNKHVIYVNENNQNLFDQNGSNNKWPMQGVFIYSDIEKQERIIVAEKARQEVKENDQQKGRYLILQKGEIYTFEDDQLIELLSFKQYEIILTVQSEAEKLSFTYKTIPSIELLLSSNKRLNAEFYYRLSAPISLFAAGFLALLLTNFKPRENSFRKLFIGIIIYVTYHNILNSARWWAADSVFSAGTVFLLIFLVVFVLIAAVLIFQQGYSKAFFISSVKASKKRI